MLWYAIHLPWLSLEALAATLPADARARPLALLAQHRVQAVNAAAAAAGVQPGLKRATALALAPALQLGQADAARDAQALQAVVHTALAFTPAVCADGATVLLEVAASQRLFGGAGALLDRLRRSLAALGHRVHIAAAPTAAGAALLARWRDDLATGPHTTELPALQRLLDEAPVWMLGPGREHWEALQGMGLRHLSDLRTLPRAGLARRFGESLLDELDRARGSRPDPRTWIVAPEHFDARLELAHRADRADELLHAAALLLARLVAWAQARQSRVQAFTLRLRHERRHRADDTTPAATALRIELAEAAVDPVHLQALLRERLARLELPAPTLEIELHCHELLQQPAPNAELFPTRQSEQAGWLRLLETLRARLGDDGVQRLQPRADHRPEQAWQVLPALQAAGAHAAAAAPRSAGTTPAAAAPRSAGTTPAAAAPRSAGSTPAAAVPPQAADLPLARPAWLLPEPQPLAERQALPWLDGRPLQLLAGPERIETGWWDGPPATRDYFIAQAGDGSLVWVYRDRLPVADAAQPLWFLQGRFG